MTCTLCGNECPLKCEHCVGKMLQPPYFLPKQEEKKEQKKFIGSGEDAHLFLTEFSYDQTRVF